MWPARYFLALNWTTCPAGSERAARKGVVAKNKTKIQPVQPLGLNPLFHACRLLNIRPGDLNSRLCLRGRFTCSTKEETNHECLRSSPPRGHKLTADGTALSPPGRRR